MDLQTFASHVLPSWVVTHFEVLSVKTISGKLEISLDELNAPPDDSGKRLESKGFLPAVYLEDFPLRGKPVLLKVRRRKWKDLTTGKTVTRDWKLAVQGTSYTEEFAFFLKKLFGLLPS